MITDVFQLEFENVGMSDLLKFNSPEWPWLIMSFTGCALSGAIMPVFAIFYGQVFAVRTQKQYRKEFFIFHIFI